MLTILGFLGFANVFAMRVNLSVTIVQMVKSQNLNSTANNQSIAAGVACLVPSTEENSINEVTVTPTNGDFDWSPQDQGQILGALFIGNVVSQIPAGILAELFGGKVIFSMGILVSSIVTLLTPLLAYQGTWCFVLSRVIIGFAQVSHSWIQF